MLRSWPHEGIQGYDESRICESQWAGRHTKYRPTGSDFGATVYQLGCNICGETYGANGGDIFERKCPNAGGRAGLLFHKGRH